MILDRARALSLAHQFRQNQFDPFIPPWSLPDRELRKHELDSVEEDLEVPPSLLRFSSQCQHTQQRPLPASLEHTDISVIQ